MSDLVNLADILATVPGITAVIGGGGKSTLLATGGRGLVERGRRVVLATSTHMFPASCITLVDHIDAHTESLVQVGTLDQTTGKLTAPKASWSELAAAADHMLVEADGSRGLPFKAHNEYEPVIPEGCARVIYVVGASGFGRPVYDAVHRPQEFRRMTGVAAYEPATPQLVAQGICIEGLVGMPDDLVVVNQAESPESLEAARTFARALLPVIDCPVYAGSLRSGALCRLA